MIWIVFLTLLVAGALSPMYVYPSGQAQPTDYVFAAMVVLVYFHSIATSRALPLAKLPLYWLGLICWIVLHCLVLSLLLQSTEFYRVIAFWTYNAAVASCFLYLIDCDDKGRVYIERAICLGLIVSGFGVFLSLSEGGRVTGFFNNPNQLAFYSLLGVSSLLVINRMSLNIRPLTIMAVLSAVAGIFAASSLAAIAGFLLVVFGYLLANLQPKRLFRFLVLIVSFFVVTSFFDDQILNSIIDNVYDRSLVAGEKFDSIGKERNYDRIFAFPEYIIIGAGEGHLERFYPYDKLEIHSSFGNLLFAYGIPGIGLFLLLVFSLLRNAPLPVWLVVSGPMVYSLTHMGLRTTLFWIFLAIVWSEYGQEKSHGHNYRVLGESS
ncbi:hypothetical protein [Onishia taeanensis]|nr:hypothetical protein [Halomonas taeanensis]